MDAWQPVLLLSLVGWFGLPLAAILVHLAALALRGKKWTPDLSVPVLWIAAAALLLHAHPWFPWGVESYFPWVFAPPLLFIRHTWPVVAAWFGPTRRRLALAMIACAILPSNALVYTHFFTTLHDPPAPWRYFLPNDTRDAIAWLAENAPRENSRARQPRHKPVRPPSRQPPRRHRTGRAHARVRAGEFPPVPFLPDPRRRGVQTVVLPSAKRVVCHRRAFRTRDRRLGPGKTYPWLQPGP